VVTALGTKLAAKPKLLEGALAALEVGLKVISGKVSTITNVTPAYMPRQGCITK